MAVPQYELFKNLVEQAKTAHEEKEGLEEFDEDAPEEFKGLEFGRILNEKIIYRFGHVQLNARPRDAAIGPGDGPEEHFAPSAE